ncbi:MAG: galactose-1-phosphate uridylyltransferase, partial [archaeon]
MPELRKDYLLDRYVIIATERAKRPNEFKFKKDRRSPKTTCPFCPGNEHMLLGVNEEFKDAEGKWLVRAVPNKYAAVTLKGNPKIETHNKFFTFAAAYGFHEVIIETQDHTNELEDMSVNHVEKVLQMYMHRIKAMNDKPNIRYVSVFKNRGMVAGASISHSHSQVIAYNALPTQLEEELKSYYDYFIKNESCPFCEIIEIEKNSDRRCYENDHFVAFTPYASRFPFEIWIFPKRHVSNIIQLNDEEVKDMAEMLKKVL